MNEFEVKGKIFRIKKMNAIETLALKQYIDFDDFNSTLKFFNLILERIEYKMDNTWLQVKQGDDYYPCGIENDPIMIHGLISKFLSWLKSVFTKSEELKES